jgi:hypothetical protein
MKLSKPRFALATAAVLTFAMVLFSHDPSRSAPKTEIFDRPYPETNANGDPIRVIFAGRIPCKAKGCEKLKVELVLYESRIDQLPTTYWLGLIGASGDDRVVTQGRWAIARGVEGYPEAPVYELDQQTSADHRYYWRVNDDIALLLDEHKRPKAGTGAWGNMLSRDATPYGPRTYTYTVSLDCGWRRNYQSAE